MKKTFLRAASAALALCTIFSLGACSKKNVTEQLEAGPAFNNIEETAMTCAEHSEITNSDGNGTVKLKCGEEIVLQADKACTVNTVTIREKGSNCTGFSIFGEDEAGERKLLFGGDVIDDYLYCSFESAEISRLILRIDSSENNKEVKISQIKAFYAKNRENNNFIVNSYFPISEGSTYFQDRVNDKDFSQYFDVITDAIIIGAVGFTKEGTLEYDSDMLKAETEALKQIIGDRNVRIWCCIANPKKENGKHANNDSVYAINNNLDILNKNLVNLCQKYGFCGIDFDWEYPRLPHVWSAYSKMLTGLGKELHDNDLLLSSALGPWGVMLTDEAKESLDLVNIMAYDWAKNSRDNHSEFFTCHYFSAEYFLKKGFRKDQLLLGVPFYGNTRDSGDFMQSGYSNFQINSKAQNIGTIDSREYYFNGYDMIYSKTAYTYDMGFAGMMIWCGEFDFPMSNQYSLFSAMKNAVESRNNTPE